MSEESLVEHGVAQGSARGGAVMWAITIIALDFLPCSGSQGLLALRRYSSSPRSMPAHTEGGTQSTRRRVAAISSGCEVGPP